MKEPIILVDIDGTLADNTHRQHHINKEKPDWPSFFNDMEQDTPILPIIELVAELWTGGYKVILVTGRPDSHREQTEAWLEQHQITYDKLLMRTAGDLRPDTEVKAELIHFIDLTRVRFALEDHSRLAKMYRGLGIMCLVVSEGRY